MTNKALIESMITEAARLWSIDPIDLRRSPSIHSQRARTVVAHFAYAHDCTLEEILSGLERGWGSNKERKRYREPNIRIRHHLYLSTVEGYRERCVQLMESVRPSQVEM